MSEIIDLQKRLPSKDQFKQWVADGTQLILINADSADDVLKVILHTKEWPELEMEAVNCPPVEPLKFKFHSMLSTYDKHLGKLRKRKRYERGSTEAAAASRKAAAERLEKLRPLIEEAIEQVGNNNPQITQWLNDNGHKNLKGQEWKVHNVQFLRSRLKEIQTETEVETNE